jgi:hypothetical protein
MIIYKMFGLIIMGFSGLSMEMGIYVKAYQHWCFFCLRFFLTLLLSFVAICIIAIGAGSILIFCVYNWGFGGECCGIPSSAFMKEYARL